MKTGFIQSGDKKNDFSFANNVFPFLSPYFHLHARHDHLFENMTQWFCTPDLSFLANHHLKAFQLLININHIQSAIHKATPYPTPPTVAILMEKAKSDFDEFYFELWRY